MHKVEETLGAGAITAVEVKGLLGEFKDSGYRGTLYGIKLLDLDPDEANSPIELVIPRRQFEQEAKRLEHQPVRVRGDVDTDLYRGRIGLRLRVRELRDLDGDTLDTGESQKNRERAVLSVLGGYRCFGRELPRRKTVRGPFKLCVIHPASGVVGRDFSGRIRDIGSNLLDTEYVPMSFQDPGAIGEAVSQTNADVIAMIRGGGDSSEFRPLNDPELLTRWMNKDAYTVSGFGHDTDSTLLDPVCDHSSATPTAAAEHIKGAIFQSAGLLGNQRPQTAPASRAGAGQGELTKWKAWAWVWGLVVIVLLIAVIIFVTNLPAGVFSDTIQAVF